MGKEDGIGTGMSVESPVIFLEDRARRLFGRAREPTTEEARTLQGRGYVLLQIDPRISLAEAMNSNPNIFPKQPFPRDDVDEEAIFPVNEIGSKTLSVGVKKGNVVIAGSMGINRDAQFMLAKIHGEKMNFGGNTLSVLPASALIQLDNKYSQAYGVPLLSGFYAQSLDSTRSGLSVCVGRLRPTGDLHVARFVPDYQVGVCALNAVVFAT